MSSKRELKKITNDLAFELIDESLVFLHFHPNENEEKINSIMEEIVSRRNQVIKKINENVPPGEIKKHFRDIKQDLLEMLKISQHFTK
ncbi:MAG: hypothetical protein ACOCUL_02285 [Bacteroidota bacterium]